MSDTDFDYSYDEEAAGHAEDFANRIDKSDLYIGEFTRAWPIVSAAKGTKGIHFEFEADGAKTNFDVYTIKADGTKIPGYFTLQAILTILNLKGLQTAPGKIEKWDDDERKRVETDGPVFPQLVGKKIGVVLQKELYNSNDGKERYRLSLQAVFDSVTRLTSSEIKEKKTKPEKLARIQRGLKDKDSRTARAAEPGQPAQGSEGLGEGGY